MRSRVFRLFWSPAARRAALASGLALGTLAGGCNSRPSLGAGTPASALRAGSGLATPLDAVPSPDGSAVYFIGQAEDAAAVYRLKDGTSARLSSGPELAAPLAIATSTDGRTIFVADLAGGDDESGAIYALPSTGGLLTVVAGTGGRAPRSLAVIREGDADQIYFSGGDADGNAAVLKVPAAGGSATLLYQGPGLSDPSGIAVSHSGTLYLVDTTRDGRSRVMRIAAGIASELVGALHAGPPAGIALAENEQALLFAGADPTGKYGIQRMPLSGSPAMSAALSISSLGRLDSPAGLHRAASADVYALVDTGTDGVGNVWLLSN